MAHAMGLVGGAAGASYITKYLDKSCDMEALRKLGFGRKWSASKDWPRGAKLRLAGSIPGWSALSWFPGKVAPGLEAQWAAERAVGAGRSVGTDLALELQSRARRRRRVRDVEIVSRSFRVDA